MFYRIEMNEVSIMKKTVGVLIISIFSSLALAQTTSPKMVSPAVILQKNTIVKSVLSLDGYLVNSKNKCMNRIGQQIKNNKTFQSTINNIGNNLKKMDDRCKYYRFEMIDYTESYDHGDTTEMRFTYRCYTMANMTLPSQNVAQAPVVKINPISLYEDVGDKAWDEELIEKECNAEAISKKLDTKLVAELKKNSNKSQPESGKSSTPARNSTPKRSGNSR